MAEKKKRVEVNGHVLNLSNLSKTLYPSAGIIKAEIIHYYMQIAPYMLRFAKDRLLSVIRFPDGIDGTKFYSKNAPEWSPDWLQTSKYYDDDINYVVFDSTHLAVWLANLAALEMHAMNSVIRDGVYIDHFVLDLDPPEGFDYIRLRDLTIEIGHSLKSKGYHPFVKTSGSRGAHIYVPITPTTDMDSFVLSIKHLAKVLLAEFPDRTTLRFRKDKRDGKILLDINRNYKAQTTVLPFSTRALIGAPVSMPMTWERFSRTISSQEFTIKTALPFIQENGNAWHGFSSKAIRLLGPDPKKKKKPKSTIIDDNKEAFPTWYVSPEEKHMLATVGQEIVESEDYVYENKWDGIRVFIVIFHGNCKILSKSNRDVTKIFPEIAEIAAQGKSQQLILDGELVVMDEQGRPDFGKIISRFHSKKDIVKQRKKYPVLLYAFDVLRADGKDCTKKSWDDRRRILREKMTLLKGYKMSDAITEGNLLYKAAQTMGLEGVMKKKRSAKYAMGDRSDAWQKIKFRTNVDCVILGYTAGEGDRSTLFGSLHIGEIIDAKLQYRGRVGTGFDGEKLRLLMDLFGSIPEGGKWFEAKTEEESRTTWFADYLPQCEIQYASKTGSGTLREPVFKKLKETFYKID